MNFAFVFPGQGSQSVGMMAAYGESAVIRQAFAEASEALGEDLWQMVADGPAEVLAQTVNTQPLMLTAGVAVYREWIARGGALPSLVAGHSLGEYSALVAAGALDFQEAVKLVRLRAQAMQEAVPQGEGAMAALLGLDEAAAVEACAEAAQGEVVSAANLNSPGQIVIAGARAAVERAMAAAKARGAKRAVLLPVSAPFHCADEAGCRASAAASGRHRSARAGDPGAQQCGCGGRDRPGAHQGCPGAPGLFAGPLDRDGAGNRPPWCDSRVRVRPGQGAGRHDQAYRRQPAGRRSPMRPASKKF
jgi:malonyl CoA-acyl carrier protein transacylase